MGMMALLISLQGEARADYVQNWVENGLYGTPAVYQTWDKAEAFLLTPALTWTGTGLTIGSGTGWTASLINPQYALATTSTPYVSATQGNFYFTTSSADIAGTFSFDWVLSYGGTIVGVDRLTWTSTGGWTYTEYAPGAAPPENRAHAPLPPSVLLLGSGLVGVFLLSRRKSHSG